MADQSDAPNSKGVVSPDDRRLAALAKGRATQAHAKGQLSTGAKAAAHAAADRIIGHTFHSHRGSK